MSFLLNSQDLKDQKISGLLMKNTINNEAPLSIKKSSKILDNNEINKYMNRSKKKKCTICPYSFSLSSSVQSTLNTLNSISQKDNSKISKFFKDLSLTNSYRSNVLRNTVHRLTRPKTDDMKILYKIFYNYEPESTLKLASLNIKREIKIINNSDNNNNINNSNKNYDFNNLRAYIIKNQTEFNEGGNVIIAENKKNIPFLIDFYIMKKLEDLIARYSLIIFLFIKEKNLKEAKKIFLLMIKENMKYFNYIEKKIIYNFNTKDKKNIQPKDNYKMVYQLIKIYSFIIRYSQLFNTMNNRNKFMGKYFRIITINFQYLLNLANIRGLNYEIKNQLYYWLSVYLTYVNYFSILNYSSFSIPITLNNIIISLYKNEDENLLTLVEKKLIINTIYNQGLFLFINNQKEEALFNLIQAEEKIKLLINEPKPKNHLNQNNNGIFSSNNNLKSIPYFEFQDKKKKLSYKSNIPLQLWKKTKLTEQNGFTSEKKMNLMKSMKSFKSGYSTYLYDDIDNICKNFIKSKISLSDITLLVEYGVENGKLSSKELNEFDTTIFSLFQKSESAVINNAIRNSQIITSKNKNQDFHFPKYLMEPLLMKIELLILEIEINKKNIKDAYVHILKSIFLLIILKYTRPFQFQNSYTHIQKILNGYLKIIDELCDEKILESNENDNENQMNSNGQLINFFNNNEEEIKKNNDETIRKEFEKFFIFLSSLSVYQIKVLNETQPKNKKRNDLPIFFSTQFKDCLSTLQRLQLDKLQTMVLSRFIILKNINRWIIPTNLNTSLLDSIKKKNSIKTKMTMNYMSNVKTLKIYSLKNNKREYSNYKKILLSKSITPSIKEFLNSNIEYALKILHNSSEEEIKYMISYPLLLVVPIKRYKKQYDNIKKNNNRKIENMIFFDNIDNGNKFENFYLRKSTKPCTERIYNNTRLSNGEFQIDKKRFVIEKKINTNKFKRRNKSSGNISIKKNIIDNINQCCFINDIKGTKDYNDSYEDYKLSIDSSFYDNEKKGKNVK